MPKLKLSSLAHDDINKYYHGTCIRVEGLDPEPKWYYFNGFGGGQKPCIRLQYEKENKIEVPQAQWKKSLVFHSVFPTGFFNFKPTTTVYCSRIPVRNVSQGISTGNFFTQSGESLFSAFGFVKGLTQKKQQHFASVLVPASRFKLTPPNIQDYLENPKYSEDIHKTLDEVRRGAVFSRALSSSIALFPHPNETGVLILYEAMPIGECLEPGKVNCFIKEFLPELADFFLPRGFSVKEKGK